MISEKCDSITATQLNNNSRSDTNDSSLKWYEDVLNDSNINITDNQQQNYNSASNNNSIVEASLPILSQSAIGVSIPTTNDKVYILTKKTWTIIFLIFFIHLLTIRSREIILCIS